MDFFDFVFWQNFVSDSFATILGVVIGIPVALLIDRLVSQWQKGKEVDKPKIIDSHQKTQLLLTLNKILQKNLRLVEQMENELKPEVVFFYNVETQLLESTSFLKYEILDDLELNLQLDMVRYELMQLHRKVELQLESGAQSTPYMYKRHARLLGEINKSLPDVKQAISSSMELISLQLKGL